jgi:hypothetical protein
MTSSRDFDRLARAWLELGPTEAPDRVVAAVLQAAETTPQVRRPFRRSFWRSFHMNRLSIAAVAVAIVAVIGGGIILTRGGDQGIGGPAASPPPTVAPSASAAPSAAALPAPLAVQWNGPPRNVPLLAPTTRTRLLFTSSSFALSGDSYPRGAMGSSASIDADGHLRLTSTSLSTPCTTGDVGTYPFTVSPGGKILTIGAGQDACAARAVAVAGTWYSSLDCKTDPMGCYGTLEAGTFPSQYVGPRVKPGDTWSPPFGAVTYTVPDGWVNSSDWPATFTLTPVANYATETKDGQTQGAWYEIAIWTQPAASQITTDCSSTEKTSVPRTVDGLIGHLTSSKAITSSKPQPITIGGYQGKWIDIQLAPGWTGHCPDLSVPSTNLLVQSKATDAWDFGISAGERIRAILLDLGQGDVVLIFVDAGDGTKFDALVAEAMPIVQSMTFK